MYVCMCCVQIFKVTFTSLLSLDIGQNDMHKVVAISGIDFNSTEFN